MKHPHEALVARLQQALEYSYQTGDYESVLMACDQTMDFMFELVPRALQALTDKREREA